MGWFREEPTLDYDNLTNEEAETALQALMEATIEVGLQHPTWGRKLWRTYQDGWSPTLLALQAHLQFIEELRSHLGNSTKRYRWPRRKCMDEIYKRSKAWEQKVERAFKRDEDPHRAQKHLGTCGDTRPSYYRLLREPPSLEFLAQERQKVLNQLHGRKRLQALEELCAYRKFMVGCYQRGRIKIFLRNLLGEHKPHFSGDTIRCPLTDIYINHPDELAWTLSLHFQDWFTKPSHHQGPITEADGDWIELGSNKQIFQDATSHLGVPEQYLDLIWAALQTVPNKQELENELNGALSDPPTEEEFRWAIHDQKKSTTPGMSNVSYGNIKDWPDELITHCYHILRVLWGREHIPQTWKEKWAVLLAKTTDTADINNLRPIGLEDCMRKLWFSISYKRIAAAWHKHGALDEAHHGFVPHRGTDSGFLDLLNQLEKAQEWGVSALVCSWDVKRAFDSVSRTAIRMALNRLRVPRNIINMVHEMEVEGITIVCTPLT